MVIMLKLSQKTIPKIIGNAYEEQNIFPLILYFMIYFLIKMKFNRENHSQKWKGKHNNQTDFVMTIAEADLPIFPAFKQAILNKLSAINNFTYKYPTANYHQCILQWYQKRHIKEGGVNIRSEYLVESPSVLNLIYIIMTNQTKQGDGILMLTPIFTYYLMMTTHLKRKVVECKLKTKIKGRISRYSIDFQDLEIKAKKSKLMIFCNPHNPTGRIWTKIQIKKIIQICQRNHILLISDQILSDFTDKQNLLEFYSLINSTTPSLVVANSISKAFNSQSLKGGYAFIKQQKLRSEYLKSIKMMNINLNEFAIICTQIYYSQKGQEWLHYLSFLTKKNYDYLLKKTQHTRLIFSQLESAYLICISFQNYHQAIKKWYDNKKDKKIEAKMMVSYFLSEHHIEANLIPFHNENTQIYTDVRFAIAVEQDYFMRFVEALLLCMKIIEQNLQVVPKL